MADGKNNKLKGIYILLIVIAAVFCITGVIAIIPEIIESERVRKEIEASVSLARANGEFDYIDSRETQQPDNHNISDYENEDTRKNVLTEVPDYIANRGIILRGDEYRESGQSYRGTTHDDSRWYKEYVTDCNLRIDSSDDDFEAFVRRFGDEVGFPMSEPGYPAYYSGTVVYERNRSNVLSLTIYRTKYFLWDCTDGEYTMPGTQGYSSPIFFDPSGRYVLNMTNLRSDRDDILLKFLEPVMTSVEVTRPGQTQPDIANEMINPEVIGSFTDAMHELWANERKDVASTILESDDVTKISFTTEGGLVHDYYFVDGKYIVYNDTVYSVRKTDSLKKLLDDRTLFMIEAP